MIVRICDVPANEPAENAVMGLDARRSLSYALLTGAEIPPADRFEFYGLSQSLPERLEIALEIESRIRETGAEVVNPPSALADVGNPAELSRRLTPNLAIRTAIEPGGELPCRLRAAYGGVCQESGWLETEREVDELLLDWILSGTDPGLILRVSTPSGPSRFHRGVRMDDDLELAERLDDIVQTSLKEALDQSQRRMAAFEYWLEDGWPHLWRVDDSWAAMSGPLAGRRIR